MGGSLIGLNRDGTDAGVGGEWWERLNQVWNRECEPRKP